MEIVVDVQGVGVEGDAPDVGHVVRPSEILRACAGPCARVAKRRCACLAYWITMGPQPFACPQDGVADPLTTTERDGMVPSRIARTVRTSSEAIGEASWQFATTFV